MDAKQFEEKINLLTRDNQLGTAIRSACLSTMQSAYAKNKYMYPAKDDFVLPKQVLTAVLKEYAFQFEPNEKNEKATCEELRTLVKI